MLTLIDYYIGSNVQEFVVSMMVLEVKSLNLLNNLVNVPCQFFSLLFKNSKSRTESPKEFTKYEGTTSNGSIFFRYELNSFLITILRLF